MHHTLIALVEDKPGVLNRVASLFRRRAFNIESLTVGRTVGAGRLAHDDRHRQRSGERRAGHGLPLQARQRAAGRGSGRRCRRSRAIWRWSRWRWPATTARALLRVVDETRAHIVDTGEQTMTLEITGEPPHVDAVIARLEPLGIIEMVRTGQVAMRRGDTALSAAQYS